MSDLTFFTNEPGHTLLDRFKSNLMTTRFFDVLVGYFYTSGFYALYKSLEKTEKIRILIGISTDKKTVEFIEKSRQLQIQFSHSEVKDLYSKRVESEIGSSIDSFEVEEGILKFLAVLQKNIPDELLKEHIAESSASTSGPREVILSEFFTGE